MDFQGFTEDFRAFFHESYFFEVAQYQQIKSQNVHDYPSFNFSRNERIVSEILDPLTFAIMSCPQLRKCEFDGSINDKTFFESYIRQLVEF